MVKRKNNFDEEQEKQKKLLKVTFEYDDGSWSIIDGQDAHDWEIWLQSCMVMNEIHGGRGPDLEFRHGEKGDSK